MYFKLTDLGTKYNTRFVRVREGEIALFTRNGTRLALSAITDDATEMMFAVEKACKDRPYSEEPTMAVKAVIEKYCHSNLTVLVWNG